MRKRVQLERATLFSAMRWGFREIIWNLIKTAIYPADQRGRQYERWKREMVREKTLFFHQESPGKIAIWLPVNSAENKVICQQGERNFPIIPIYHLQFLLFLVFQGYIQLFKNNALQYIKSDTIFS